LRPDALLRFYWIRLRSRRGAELLAFAGIAVGVALVFAALVANASLVGAVRELSEGVVGKADFQIAARSTEGFDPRVLRQVGRIRGAAAVPVVEARVNLVGTADRASVLLVGGDPRFRPSDGLVISESLASELGAQPGRALAVESATGTARAVVASSGSAQLGALADAPVAFAPLQLAQELTGMGPRLSRIFVAVPPGREEAVEAALRRIAGDRLNVAPANQEVAVFERAAYPTSASTTLFSLLSGIVGFLFALNATLLIVPQRRRLIQDLRLAGYAPPTVLQVLLLDALLLGLAGSAAGLLLGEVASRLLFDAAPGYLESAFAIGSQRIATLDSALVAAAGGVAAACLSVLLPVRDVLRSAPQAPRPGLTISGQLALGGLGIACFALSIAIVAAAPGYSPAGLGILLLALLMLLQVWLQGAAVAFDAASRRHSSPVAMFAALELRAGSARIRTLALAATGAVAVFATVAIGGARADLQRGLDGVVEDVDQGASVWIAFGGSTNIFGTTGIPVTQGQLQAIERLRGVRAVSRNRSSFLDIGRSRAWAIAPASSRIGMVLRRQIEDADAATATQRLRHGDWVVLSGGLADELEVEVGDEVDIPFPNPIQLRVAATATNFGWPGGALVVSGATYRRAWRSRAVNSLGIQLESGVAPQSIVGDVRWILGPHGSMQVETTAERIRQQRAASRAGLSRLRQISILVLVSSVLAMAASMAGVVWQRRPTLAALKLHGVSEGELWRAMLLEAGLLLGAGCACGALFGLVGQLLLDHALETITGFPISYAIALPLAGRVVVLIVLSAIGVLALPGWIAVGVRPRAGLAAE
jgi:putative ABC transport system permease protein